MSTTNNGIQNDDRMRQIMVANAALSMAWGRRRDLGHSASTLYAGARDIYDVVGYPSSLDFTDYYGRWQRQGLAKRIVRAHPDDTWRKPPVVKDGMSKDDARDDTPFTQAWQELVGLGSTDDDPLNDTKTLWHYFARVDRLAGIGEYAVLVLGMAGSELSQPLSKSNQLAYVGTYNQAQAEIRDGDIVKDPNDRRFGLPNVYHIDLGTNTGKTPVHHTRIIHVADGLEDNELYGTPRLQAVYNQLIDIEKLMAATGEAGWRMTTRKIVLSTKDGYQLATTTVTASEVEDLIHNLRDVVELEGFDVTVLSGEMVDPSKAFDKNIELISAATGIPKRILMGSERGELASSQDTDNWYDDINTRRVEFAEPVILRPFINRMVYAGVLPKPTVGIYFDWPSLYESDDSEQATIASTYADVVTKLAAPGVSMVIDPGQFLKTYMRGLPDDAIVVEPELLREEYAQSVADAQQLGQQDSEDDQDDTDAGR